jgi:hypothetical protein
VSNSNRISVYFLRQGKIGISLTHSESKPHQGSETLCPRVKESFDTPSHPHQERPPQHPA